MCLLCVEIQKDKITFREVYQALGEFTIDPNHKEEFMQLIDDKFGPEYVWKIAGEDDGTD